MQRVLQLRKIFWLKHRKKYVYSNVQPTKKPIRASQLSRTWQRIASHYRNVKIASLIMVQSSIGSRKANMDNASDSKDFNASNSSDEFKDIITKFNSLYRNSGHACPECKVDNCFVFAIFYFTELDKLRQMRKIVPRNEQLIINCGHTYGMLHTNQQTDAKISINN